MTRVVPNPPPGFERLSVDEQIEYLQSLWDLIAAAPKAVPVPGWHSDILEERERKFQSQPDAGRSWEDVRRDIEQKIRDATAK